MVARPLARFVAAGVLIAALAGPVAHGEPIWSTMGAVSDSERAYSDALDAAEKLAVRAAELVNDGSRNRRRGQQMALIAVDSYEKAASVFPKRAEPHYRAAEILDAHFISPPGVRSNPPLAPTLRAIRHWTAFEQLAPKDPRLADCLFNRSLAFTKLGGEDNFAKAVTDYDKRLALMDTASSRPERVALIMTNAAEILMGLGRLDEAIEFYSGALEHHPDQLYGYGLAVALDRNGQAIRARQMMKKHQFHPDVMIRNTVFFVPDGDEHWYYALGNESRGKFESARNHYREFVRRLPKSQYAPLAQKHIKRLEAAMRRGKGTKTPADPYEHIWSNP